MTNPFTLKKIQRRLSIEQYFAVRRALRRGKRHVDIARLLKLSMWTIARIADERYLHDDPVLEADLPEDDAPPDYAPENLRRCRGCGAMVYVWPCVACEVREVMWVPEAEEEPEV